MQMGLLHHTSGWQLAHHSQRLWSAKRSAGHSVRIVHYLPLFTGLTSTMYEHYLEKAVLTPGSSHAIVSSPAPCAQADRLSRWPWWQRERESGPCQYSNAFCSKEATNPEETSCLSSASHWEQYKPRWFVILTLSLPADIVCIDDPFSDGGTVTPDVTGNESEDDEPRESDSSGLEILTKDPRLLKSAFIKEVRWFSINYTSDANMPYVAAHLVSQERQEALAQSRHQECTPGCQEQAHCWQKWVTICTFGSWSPS